MTVTRTQLITRAARLIGARTGNISSGTANTAVLSGLINTTGYDESFKGWRLIMLDAANETDKERWVDAWDDRTGTAHFAIRSDSTYTSETYILVHPDDYALQEFRDALDVALREGRRSYRWPVPLAPNQRVIPLSDLTFLTGADDIAKVMRSDNPNMVRNAEFNLWSAGLAAAPDGWTLTGTGASVARASTGIRSGFGVTVTRASAATTLTQTIPLQLLEYICRSPGGITSLAIGGWVTTATASSAKIGVNSTFTSFHTGGSYPEWLSTTFTPASSNTAITITLQLDTNSSNATFHGIYLVVGTAVPDVMKEQGDQAYREREVNHRTRNLGGAPVVQLDSEHSGQIVVYTRRGFSALSADSSEIDDQYARQLEAGLLAKLLQITKSNQDRTRLDVIQAEQTRIWTRLLDNTNDLPVDDEPATYIVRGA